ncbi:MULTISPECIES: DUF2167 domain-containing protein [Hydrogenophaga]|uniref:DUF2167 domain-containing protein n=1 Tax=Hydrogenophaga TaxID=47420 RepID=UPI000879052D|nr:MULTISPECIES: DUF2167 domain-containing protein [unclassified Hydrogenophaga]MBN9372533.1 DUF2167 domain-containing protein [Hydrogenophaga sp.]OJV57322.1 MAG: hypothetical protein BGO22_04060 [Hydrogenophaga sp. 70-12]
MTNRYHSALVRLALGSALALAAGALTLAQAQDKDAAQAEMQRKLASLSWYTPGQVGDIAGKATFAANEKYTFLNPADTDTFLQLNGNPPQRGAYTVASTQTDWFAILNFAPEGYVKDDETIDADALLKQLKDNNGRESEERRKQGYPVLTLTGWAIAPRYDAQNKRLEWGTLLRDESTQQMHANVSTKVLGRSGYTNVVLVTSPDTVERDLADFKTALGGFNYVSGEKYSDWKQGDKVAAYGLGALVLGGAAAVATSKGGLKALGIAVLGGLAALWAGIKRFLGRSKKS